MLCRIGREDRDLLALFVCDVACEESDGRLVGEDNQKPERGRGWVEHACADKAEHEGVFKVALIHRFIFPCFVLVNSESL